MDNEELKEFRTRFNEESLRFLVLVYTFELYGMMLFLEDGTRKRLTPRGRELANELFEEEKYRDYAIEKVDLARKDSSRADLQRNYLQ